MWHNNSPSDLEILQPGALPQAVHPTSLTYLVVGCTALGWAACCVLVLPLSLSRLVGLSACLSAAGSLHYSMLVKVPSTCKVKDW